MFTGIIEELGSIHQVKKVNLSAVVSLHAPKACKDTAIGDSIAINGACLTVVYNKNNLLKFDVSKETLEKTNIGLLKQNDKVNIERAIKAGQRLGGHFVTGHIDCSVEIIDVVNVSDYAEVLLKNTEEIQKYIVPKASVAIDGISLTINKVNKDIFSVYLIPHTLKHTTFAFKKRKDLVNIETDILAKYVTSRVKNEKSNISFDFLSEHGFA